MPKWRENLAKLGVASELAVDLSRRNGVPEMAEYYEKVPCISARPHVGVVPDGSVTDTCRMCADTCIKELASEVRFSLTSVVCFITSFVDLSLTIVTDHE